MTAEEYMDTLRKKTELLKKYYDIDKVKPYGVYVWNKEDEKGNQENIFDIYKDEITFYTDDHTIIEEAKPIIKDIQKFIKDHIKEYATDVTG